MDRDFLRRVAVEAGYKVRPRSSHGVTPAYDWGPKSPMDGRHFSTEADAWADLETAMLRRLADAQELLGAAARVLLEGAS